MSHDHEPHTEAELKQELHDHDEWFRHSPDEPEHMEAHGAINSVYIIGYMVLTIVAVVVVAGLIMQYVYHTVREQRDTRIETVVPRSKVAGESEIGADAVARWNEELNEWAWVEEGSTAQIPIDVAIQQIVEQYK